MCLDIGIESVMIVAPGELVSSVGNLVNHRIDIDKCNIKSDSRGALCCFGGSRQNHVTLCHCNWEIRI